MLKRLEYYLEIAIEKYNKGKIIYQKDSIVGTHHKSKNGTVNSIKLWDTKNLLKEDKDDPEFEDYFKDNQIGVLTSRNLKIQKQKTHPLIDVVKVHRDYKNKGYSKLMYKLALKHLPKKFNGLESNDKLVHNPKIIHKIRKGLGAIEVKPGIFHIDRNHPNTKL